MSSLAPPLRLVQRLASLALARRHWQVALVVLTGVICFLALTPTPPQEVSLGWDKANHALAFVALTVAGCFGFRGVRHGILWVSLGVFALGGLIEIVQLFVPGRSCDWHDLLADAVGIGLGVMFALAALKLAEGRR